MRSCTNVHRKSDGMSEADVLRMLPDDGWNLYDDWFCFVITSTGMSTQKFDGV